MRQERGEERWQGSGLHLPGGSALLSLCVREFIGPAVTLFSLSFTEKIDYSSGTWTA